MDDDAHLMMDVKEVARLLNVSPDYVRDELIRKGRLDAIRYTPRGQFRIHPHAVDKLLGRPISQARNSPIARRKAIREAETIMKRLGVPLNEGLQAKSV